jgi:hypothetical protein
MTVMSVITVTAVTTNPQHPLGLSLIGTGEDGRLSPP